MEASPELLDQGNEPELPHRNRLPLTSPHAMVQMRFDLDWSSSIARHRDSFVATRMNLWRDIFPAGLEAALMGKPVGHQAKQELTPGGLLDPWQPGLQVPIRNRQFNRRYLQRGYVAPRVGRFYPKGILEQVDGVFRADRHPFRLVGVTDEKLLIDLNPPLSGRTIGLSVTIEDIWALGEERGGRCNDLGQLLTENGPGMQGRWQDQPTDFWSDMPFFRKDPSPDADFYGSPRLVDHLDSAAIEQVSQLYGRLLPHGARILDLMASWHSHLPANLEPSHVTGLGMNRKELEANSVLAEHTLHDLNLDPRLPYPDASFDAVVCTVSVEYLVRPFEVFEEVARVLRPHGRFVVTFSNRWFPPKVVRIWEGIHEFERPGLVLEYFAKSGRFTNLETWSLRGLPRPADDKHADRLALSDPVHAVWGERV